MPRSMSTEPDQFISIAFMSLSAAPVEFSSARSIVFGVAVQMCGRYSGHLN